MTLCAIRCFNIFSLLKFILQGGGDADGAAAGGFGQHAGASSQGETTQNLKQIQEKKLETSSQGQTTQKSQTDRDMP